MIEFFKLSIKKYNAQFLIIINIIIFCVDDPGCRDKPPNTTGFSSFLALNGTFERHINILRETENKLYEIVLSFNVF